jgi:2-isopropylmalate synthase
VGDLVFTAFSGSHQDAIAKGFAAQRDDALWRVPYLPIDPKDLGRTYDSIVRVNSQSGKGGISYLLQRDHGIVMPRRMQVEFSAIVQALADASETELSSAQIWALFEQTYLEPSRQRPGFIYRAHRCFDAPEGQGIELQLAGADGALKTYRAAGNDHTAATVAALGMPLRIDSCEARGPSAEAGNAALAIVEMASAGIPGSRFGVGLHPDTATAAVLAVLNAAARLATADAPAG